MDGFSKDGFTASVHPLSVSGTEAVALTRETYYFHSGAMVGSAVYDWKQTWRMTPQGWRLAIIEIKTEQGAKDFDNAHGLTFTVTPQAKKRLQAQEKQSVVK